MIIIFFFAPDVNSTKTRREFYFYFLIFRCGVAGARARIIIRQRNNFRKTETKNARAARDRGGREGMRKFRMKKKPHLPPLETTDCREGLTVCASNTL